MTPAQQFIHTLQSLKPGDLGRLRKHAGMPLDETLEGFDLFTGLWWPLRRESPRAPRREVAWLLAKLYGAFPIPHVRPNTRKGPTLPEVLRRCEPPCPACPNAALLSSKPPDREPARGRFLAARTFRRRFDTLLCSPLPALEPHLRRALAEIAKAVAGRVPWAAGVTGMDWAQLLDDLSIWDRGQQHRRKRDIRDVWAEHYLNATH